MKTKNIILIAIAIIVVALIAAGIYSVYNGDNILNPNTDDSNTGDVNNTTVVGDNSPRTNLTINNTTYKAYNPQSDSYVPVIGEKYDEEVNRWYTYDEDGVRYYNTRIN